MSSNNVPKINSDEETPLLPKLKPEVTPLPWFQFSIILFAQFAEPLITRAISPFTPQLIREIGVTHEDESKVGYYLGLLQSLFYFGQACTVLYHSKISDLVGRKPVILFGLLGCSLPIFPFGLSKTFEGLAFSRYLNGALDGNIGVLKSMVVEITDSTNIPKAFAYMNMAYGAGSTVGPLIGGSLSHPTERLPQIFGDSVFLKLYPYFLPCAVAAAYAIVCWMVVYFLLEETVTSRRPLSQLLNIRRHKADVISSQNPVIASVPESNKPLPLRSLLTSRVIISAGNYAALSLFEICFSAVQVLFFATPVKLGGLGLSPLIIGNILSCFSALDIIGQYFFSRIHDRLGSKNTYLLGILGCFPIVAIFPLMNCIARMSDDAKGLPWSIWALIGCQILLFVFMSFSYGAIFVYISSAPPNRASVGAVNGLSQTTVSLMRAAGPAAISSIFSLSMKYGYLGGYLVYVILTVIVVIATGCALMLPKKVWRD